MAQRLDVQYVRYTTDGSAARKLAPAFPRKQTATKPKQHKQKAIRIYVDPAAILGIVVAAAMLITMAVGVFRFMAIRNSVQEMERYVTNLNAQNQELTQTYQNGYDLEEVKTTALALGMVPQEQARQIAVSVPVPEMVEEPISVLERVGTFLTGLFA